VRRPLSLISAAVLAATSLVALSQSPVSASSAATVVRSATTAPASISGANTMRALRLARSNQMFVVGANISTPGSALHLWKVNDDLSMDTTFGAVSLGTNFTLPTAANSTCVANPRPGYTCSFLTGFSINETADRYAIAFSRQLSGSGNRSNISNTINSVALGKISTGEILASVNIGSDQTGLPLSDWSQYNPVDMGKNACTAATGATLNGTPLEYTFLLSLAIRPDGSLILGTTCDYSNRNVFPTPTSINEYETSLLYALKPSSGALVLDTSFGTNGVVVTFNDITKCGFGFGVGTINTALTSNDSPALFAPINVLESPRTTTLPSWFSGYQGVTSYSGCERGFSPSTSSSKLITMQANGTIKNTLSFPNNMSLMLSRWVIDPQGRWNTTSSASTSGASSSQATYFVRLTSDGAFDTTVGANGMKEMTNLPTTVTVGGTSVRMNYDISGFATTATGILFTGFASAMNPSSIDCRNPPNTTNSLYPFYIALNTGLLTTYGTGGLGDAITLESPGSDTCSSNLARTSFINAKGQHMYFAETRALGAQSAGLMMATWNAAPGVTGGGDGGGAVGTMSRTDNKVYSRKLPTTTQEGTALKVLTKKASRTQMLRSTTPKICVTLTESVVLVDEGRCNVQIVNKEDRRVVRSLSTRVRSTDVEVGTTVEVEDAIPFARVSTRLSKAAQEQVAELAESAATAKRIILVGHTALLTEATVSNNFISLQRAAAVKAALQAEFKKAGVNVPISITALGSRAPLTTRSSEAAQSRNRRVDVYVMP
jgi:outer membrane protein OmpA-like peptidoglycan-associated protein